MTDKNEKEVKKYLTEIKELPSYEDGKRKDPSQTNKQEAQEPKTAKSEEKDMADEVEQAPPPEQKAEPEKTTVTAADLKKKDKDTKDTLDDLLSPKSEKSRKILGVPFETKDIILNAINIVTLILLVVIMTRIDDKAAELKSVKNENLRLSENYNYDLTQVNEDEQKAQELEDLFTTDSGVIDFVADVENLQESGAIRRVSFSSPDPVQDKSKSYGRPIIIRLAGTWQQIDEAIEDIHGLPYLFRPVRIEIVEGGTDNELSAGQVGVNYGGLLYIENPNNGEDQ